MGGTRWIIGRGCSGALAVLAVVLVASPAAAAGPVSGTVHWRAGAIATGNDISYPQCGTAFPTGAQFGIVGVNDGLANTLNPCLGLPAANPTPAASELAWAVSTSASGAGQPAASLYVNTADPGNVVQGTPIADWPRSGTTPDGLCAPLTGTAMGQDSMACAWEYGYRKAAQDALWLTAAAIAVDRAGPPMPVPSAPSAYPWWLDVETANSWLTQPSGLAMNVADLLGMVAALRQAGATQVGLYSTAGQWAEITGGDSPALGSLNGLPEWVPGASTAAGAVSACAAPPFAAGPVDLAEWQGQPVDGDVLCPLGAPTQLAAVPQSGQAQLSWTAPAAGGSPLTAYTVAVTDTTTGTALPPVTLSGSPPPTTATITHLVSGDTYSLEATASTAQGTGPASAPLAVTEPAPFHPLAPMRLCDTRPAATPVTACTGHDLGPGAVLTVPVAGVVPAGSTAAPVPLGATAAVLNLTATDTTRASALTVWPAGAPRPRAPALSWTAGATVAELVTVPLGLTGAVDLFNRRGAAAVVVDVEGYYGPASPASLGLGLTPVEPTRLCDTRIGAPEAGPCAGHWLGPASTLAVAVTGGVVPAGAAAAVLTVTVTDTTASSVLTVWPAGSARPLASTLNWAAGATRSNRVIVPLSTAGAIDLYNAHGSAAVVIDVAGYFGSAGTGLFEPVAPLAGCATAAAGSPVTVCSSRSLVAGRALTFPLAGSGGVPASAAAALVTVIVTAPTAASYLTAYPAGTPRPLASDANVTAGEVQISQIVVGLGTGGAISLTLAAGAAEVEVVVTGWFT